MKTQEELQQLKNEYESLTTKLKELTEDELKEVSGGLIPIIFSENLKESLTESGVKSYIPLDSDSKLKS